MQLSSIVNDFNFDKVVVFDKDAIVVLKRGSIDDMLIVELTQFYKQIAQFEIISINEVVADFKSHSIIGKKLDEYYLTVILEKNEKSEKIFHHFSLLYNRLKRELLS